VLLTLLSSQNIWNVKDTGKVLVLNEAPFQEDE
jgi:hypothetical protein